MKLTRFLLMLAMVMLLMTGCSETPATPAGLALYPGSGVDQESWIVVPAGDYLAGQFEERAHIDSDFEIMVTEVTNAQYVKYLNGALAAGTITIEAGTVLGSYPGDEFNQGRHEKRIDAGHYLHLPFEDAASRIDYAGGGFSVKADYENHPVTMVTWFGAKAYADFYDYRLPTESEWEKAARGTDNRPYPWGHQIQTANANFRKSGSPFQTENGWSDTTPVGFYNGQSYGDFQTIDSPSPYGVHDMAGNVAEWVGDLWPGTHDRIMKGGHKDAYPSDARIWKRNSAPPDYCSPNVGFRCVRDL